MTNVLITGGSGLLGTELKKLLPDALTPPREILDVSKEDEIKKYLDENSIDTIIHCASTMPAPMSDKDPVSSIEVNIMGTCLLVIECIKRDIKFIYISTDYVFKGTGAGNYDESDGTFPVNKYAWSKLGGECAAQMHDKMLIIRSSFGPKIYQHEKGIIDQWTSKEPVDKIAAKIVKLVRLGACGTFHVGGPKRTVYEYAQESKPDIKYKLLSDIPNSYKMPRDTSLDCSKYERFIND